MPSKKTLAKILRSGGPNPFAVAGAMVKKGQIHASEKEKVIQGVTRSALAKGKKKKRKTKGCH